MADSNKSGQKSSTKKKQDKSGTESATRAKKESTAKAKASKTYSEDNPFVQGKKQDDHQPAGEGRSSFVRRVAEDALRMAWKTGITTLNKASNFVQSPENLRLIADAGESLRDMREVAGLTRDELAEALDLSDKGLVEAVENGTATLSFELILRLSALLARHDPVPFVLKYVRAYNPEVWKLLETWGPARVTTQYERERKFINIMRGHDAARKLSDEGFAEVLKFTRSSFEMALHFVAQQENVEDTIVDPESPESAVNKDAERKKSDSK
jgi:transcriptional regulator with XRE-family HTH domain